MDSGAISERAPPQKSLKLFSQGESLAPWALGSTRNSGVYVNDLLFEMYAPNSEASYSIVPSWSSSKMHMTRVREAEGGGGIRCSRF
jgi:hypothetical protein